MKRIPYHRAQTALSLRLMTLRLMSATLAMTGALFCAPALAQSADRAAPPQTAPKAVYVWKNADMRGGGFVPGVVFHPTEKGLLYARTDIGGAYRFDAQTGRWIALLDFLGHDDAALNGVLSIGLDPNDAERLYLATGLYTWESDYNRKGALLISKDRGQTFDIVNLPFRLGGNEDGRSTGERLQVDPNLGSVLFLGTSRDGLWTSADQGRTWSKTSLSARHVLFVLFAPGGAKGTASQTLYAGIEDRDGKSLYVSTDGGRNWKAVAGTPKGLMPHHADFGADGKLYLSFANGLGPNGVTGGAVMTYDPATGAWADITPLKPGGESFGYAGLSIDRRTPGALVVSTLDRWGSGDEIFRSTDYGKSWSPVSPRSHFDTADAPWLVPFSGGKHDRIGHWLGDIDIDPFDSNHVIYVTGYGLWESRSFSANGTLDWHFSNAGLEETVPLELISPPQGAHLISALGDIGGFRHDDLFSVKASTYFQPSGVTTRGLDFAEDKPEVVVRTSDRKPYGYYSTDGGKSWTGFASAPPTINDPQGNGVQTMGIAINADATRLMWMPAGSEAYVSTDMGRTWEKSSGGPVNTDSHIWPVSDRVNPNRFYLYDNRKKAVYYSTDGGVSFKMTLSPQVPDWGSRMRAVPGQEGHLWLGGWNGLSVSDNGGQTFMDVPGFNQVWAVAFGKAAPDQDYPAIFVWGKSGTSEGVFMSYDLGGRWVKLTYNRQKFGAITSMTGDPRVFGRLYLGVGGRGIMVGDFVLTGTDKPAGETK